MSYSAQKLVTGSYYLSGIVSKSLQSLQGDQLNDGVDLLNDVLAVKAANTSLIPYYNEYDFNGVAGQEMYFVPNLLEPQTMTFNIGDVRYQMSYQGREAYFGSSRVDNIQSLPFNWHFERVENGSNVYLYFTPQSNYPIKIWGKFGFTSVSANTDLSAVYDRFYIVYLKYALAEYICDSYSQPIPGNVVVKLKELRKELSNVSPPDFTTQKLSTLTNGTVLNWGIINLSNGWVPG